MGFSPDPPARLPPDLLQPLHTSGLPRHSARTQVQTPDCVFFISLCSWLLYKVSNINSYIVTIIVVDIYQHLASLVQRFYTIDDGNVTNKKVSSRHNEMICITIFSLTPTPAKKHLLHGQRSQRFHSTPVPVRKPMSVPDIV